MIINVIILLQYIVICALQGRSYAVHAIPRREERVSNSYLCDVRMNCYVLILHIAVVTDVFRYDMFNIEVVIMFVRSTPKSRPNKVGLRCLSVHTSVRPQKVFLIPMKFGM